MSSDETTTETAEAGGEDGPSRIAGGCVLLILAAIGVLVVKSVVTAAPYVAYFVAGILCTVGAQKARARWGRKRRQDDEGEDEAEDVAPPDVAGALRRLVGDDKGVLLTALRDDLELTDTKAVKGLLEDAGIPWKAVRTREGNGPAVHRDDIPPTPSPDVAASHGDGCCCRSDANNNSNNADEQGPGEGIRVQRTETGLVIYDLADTHRHHTVDHQ